MKKIVLSCGDGYFNFGDEAITSSIVTNLRKLIKDIEITVFSSDPERTKNLHGTNSIKMEMSAFGFITGIFRMLRFFPKMDLLVWGGGNLITDAPSQLFTPFHLTKVLLAKLMRKKVIVYGIGVGPLTGSFGKFLTKIIINKADVITVRDEGSKKVLIDVGVRKPKIYVTADPTIILEPANPSKVIKLMRKDGIIKKAGQPLIAVVPRRVFHRKSSSIIPVKYKVKFGIIDKESKIKFEKFEETLARAADYLKKKLDARIVFIPMQMSSSQQQQDEKISAEIIEKMRYKKYACILNSNKYKMDELKGIYGQMNLILGVRFHALVFACSMEKPIVAISYSPKGRRLTKYLEIEKYAIPAEEVEYKNLIEKVNLVLSNKESIKKNFKEKNKILKRKAKFNIKLVFDMLK